MSIEINHENDAATGRYHLVVDGVEAGEIDYRTDGDVRVFVHTGVRDEFEGQGLAGKLAEHALDDARSNGIKIGATCPYVRSYLERHPEYQDLLAAPL
ncbi:MAG: hypothetical protein JWO77_1746 [Ilumatobacteraceae bacterium]|nr:hypothetical protein [Ilumatobacteraceae bacterium]